MDMPIELNKLNTKKTFIRRICKDMKEKVEK